MTDRARRVAVFLGAATLASGAAGVSAATKPDNAKTTSAARRFGPPAGGPDEMAAALGKELGLPAAKVQSASQSLRPGGGPPPQQGGVDPSTQLR